jgi:6-phosphogluconolactonase|tara:strand:- start:453 stop:1055 length:603 start_codon:yes stop_codon:yes gene_type:complete
MKIEIKKIKENLKDSISFNDEASIVVSGGSSPINFLQALDNIDLEWHKVRIMLLDERLVNVKDKKSNEKTLKDNFFKNYSKSAHYQSIRNLEFSNNIDLAILGFGLDGHFASIFPCHLNENKFIDINSKPKILKTKEMGNPQVARLTLNLAAFSKVKNISIICNSNEKFKVLNDAKNNSNLPLHHLLKLEYPNIEVIKDF